jgi:uncharacterized protein (DUF885 family)
MIKRHQLLTLVIIISTLLGACGKVNTPTQEALLTTTTPLPPAHVTIASETPTGKVPQAATDAQSLVSDLSTGLDGLDFDAFVEESYRRLLSRDPETVLELGLSEVYNAPTDQLTDISDGYIRQTQTLESKVLAVLQQYDRSALTPDQQLTYDIYAWYLDDKVKGQEFMYDDYPINPTVFSVHLDLLQFFTDLRPMTDLQDAQDYVTSLEQVDIKLGQLVDGLQKREAQGVVLPRFLINWILGDLNALASSDATSTPYYTAFETKLNALGNISKSEKQSLLTSAEDAVNDSVLPGYQSLVKYLEQLQSVATNDAGVWKFTDGEAYYTYALQHYTSTNLTADEIHELGLQSLDNIHAQMRIIFNQLGYPEDESLPELYARLAADSGTLSGAGIVQGYEDIITTVEQYLGGAFDLRPSAGVIVVGGPTGGYYYMPPAIDGSRPGMFYAQNTGIQPGIP